MTVASPLTISSTFDRVVRIYPKLEAAVDSRSRLTFAELDESSRRCVALLRSAGVNPRMIVGLLTLPSVMHLVSWLAVVRLGAIPLVLHTRESTAVLQQICEKFEVAILIYDQSISLAVEPLLASSSRKIVGISIGAGPSATCSPFATIPEDLSRHEPSVDLPTPRESDIATIILSSGTTSLPKGLAHTHRSMVEAARTALSLFVDLRPGRRVIVPYSTAFTGCYASWVPFLNVGACSVFQEKFEPLSFLSTVKREQISHVSLTPSMWRMVLSLDSDRETYRSVRQASFAGEPMDTTTLERIRVAVTPNINQSYGATEMLGMVTAIFAEDMNGERLNSVGRPLANVELRIVKQGGELTDILTDGELGEVVVTSPSIADGVWSNEELTNKLFHFDGERHWWRSGDLGRIDSNGFLFLQGRSDDMILSGGINIMPATVEEVLIRHASVNEVAVVGLPHPVWGQQVHAFVVTLDPELTAETLDVHVRESGLSGYQRPRAYHFVSEIPRTNTNKLNRRALREAGVPE